MSIFNSNMYKTPDISENFFINNAGMISKEKRSVKLFFQNEIDLRNVYLKLSNIDIEKELSGKTPEEILNLSRSVKKIEEKMEKGQLSTLSNFILKIINLAAKIFRFPPLEIQYTPDDLQKIQKIQSAIIGYKQDVKLPAKPHLPMVPVLNHPLSEDTEVIVETPPVHPNQLLKNELETFLNMITPDETKMALQTQLNRLALNARVSKIGDSEFKITLEKERNISGLIQWGFFSIPLNFSFHKEMTIKFFKGTGHPANHPEINTEQICVSINPPLDCGTRGGKITMIASDRYVNGSGITKSVIALEGSNPRRMDPSRLVENMKTFKWD